MEVGERLVSVLSSLGLDDIEAAVWEPYHVDGAGRPSRNPLGIFKALVVKRLRSILGDRDLYRRLWGDPELREICYVEDYDKPYHSSQLCHFRKHVRAERLERIMNMIIGRLLDSV